jgi:secreted protein with Ig-like and vWFA domain
MNSSNENNEPTQLADPNDRLIDSALAELVGGQTPPDLSNRILAAKAPPEAVVAPVPRTRKTRAFWATLAVAAMILIGFGFSFVLSTQHARETARSTARQDRLTSQSVNNVKQLGEAVAGLQDQHAAAVAQQSMPVTLSEQSAGAEQGPPAPSEGREAGSLPSPYYLTDDVQHQAPPASGGTLALGKTAIPSAASAGNGSMPLPESQLVKQGAGTVIISDGDAASIADPSAPVWEELVGRQKDYYATTDLGTKVERLHLDVPRQESELQAGSPEVKSTENGIGPGLSGDQYTRIFENPFIKAQGEAAVSTFSIDVDTASYSNVRQFLLEMNQLPPPDAVRIEELVNYFRYNYAPPISPDVPVPYNTAMANAYVDAKAKDFPPFAAHVEVASCPWNNEHRLARIAVKGREMDAKKRPQSNLVFLVDVSGSMDEPAKLPLVVYGLEQLAKELGENDRVAIVVYASSEGLVLDSTSGTKQKKILKALGKLKAGGSTAGGAGIQLAYQLAEDNFFKGGTNRVILCTDGDFNVGVTSTAELERMVEKKAKDTGVFLSVLGFGRGNLNDSMMEAIADHGNGNYHYVDNRTEARRVLVEEMTGTLVTIAKDVKIQVEFNPAKVAGYRLIGYENRMLRTEDFNDDKKDAGEIGAGHTVTALYEVVPAGKKVEVGAVDELKYQKPPADEAAKPSDELLTLKMRYKAPDGDASKKLEWPVKDDGKSFGEATGEMQFAAAVAGFGMLLRDSQYKGNLTYAADLELAQGGIGRDEHGYRKEFLEMVRKAKELRHE